MNTPGKIALASYFKLFTFHRQYCNCSYYSWPLFYYTKPFIFHIFRIKNRSMLTNNHKKGKKIEVELKKASLTHVAIAIFLLFLSQKRRKRFISTAKKNHVQKTFIFNIFFYVTVRGKNKMRAGSSVGSLFFF